MREMYQKIGWEKKVVVFFAALILLVVLGPFATYEDLSLEGRLVFWSISLAGVGFFMHITITTALSWSALEPLPKLLRLVCGSALGALPGTAVVCSLIGSFVLTTAVLQISVSFGCKWH